MEDNGSAQWAHRIEMATRVVRRERGAGRNKDEISEDGIAGEMGEGEMRIASLKEDRAGSLSLRLQTR